MFSDPLSCATGVARRPTVRRRRARGWLAALTVATVVAGSALAWRWQHPAAPRGAQNTAPQQPFTLHDQEGRRVDTAALAGQWLLVQFADTRCGARCDQVSRSLATTTAALPWHPTRRVTALWVTVDPAHDDVARVRQHLRHLNPPHDLRAGPAVRGLTGSAVEIDNLALALGISASGVCGTPADAGPRVPADTLFVITPDRRVAAALPGTAPSAVHTAYLQALWHAN